MLLFLCLGTSVLAQSVQETLAYIEDNANKRIAKSAKNVLRYEFILQEDQLLQIVHHKKGQSIPYAYDLNQRIHVQFLGGETRLFDVMIGEDRFGCEFVRKKVAEQIAFYLRQFRDQ